MPYLQVNASVILLTILPIVSGIMPTMIILVRYTLPSAIVPFGVTSTDPQKINLGYTQPADTVAAASAENTAIRFAPQRRQQGISDITIEDGLQIRSQGPIAVSLERGPAETSVENVAPKMES